MTDAPDDTVIGDRSFGADPTAVTDYAGAYARGLRDAGLLPGAQALPGPRPRLGRHAHRKRGRPRRSRDLQNNDLIPYRTLTAEAPVGVMVGHIQVPGLTGSDPASLSPAAYALLRSGDYGGPPFNGPVFTDDLSSMQADQRPVRRRRGGAARAAGRRGHGAVGDDRRGPCGAGPAGEGAGGRGADDAAGRRVGAADGRGERPESALRPLIGHLLLTLE